MVDIPTIEEFDKPAKRAAASPDIPFWSFKIGQEYYTGTGTKVTDFFIGLLGSILIGSLLKFLPFYFGIMRTTTLVLFIAVLVAAFVFGRRWIGFGMLALLAIILIAIAIILAVFL